jgi:tetratricopeptide (TPR) repeat protein
MIVSANEQTQETVKLTKLSEAAFEEKTEIRLNSLITESIEQILQILELVDELKYKEALIKVSKLRKERPEIAYFYFLEASVQHQLGQKGKAIESLKAGLKLKKDDPKALEYYRELAGE